MLYDITGTVSLIAKDFIVLHVHGVGYRIATSETTKKQLTVGQETKIYTHLHVREDALELFGFSTTEELSTFTLLLSINGVGPKVALALLSTIPPSEFAFAVVTGNVKIITRAPGIGPKVAQRIILELKDKLKTEEAIAGYEPISEPTGESTNDAVHALMVLGYPQTEAQKAVNAVSIQGTVEDVIREALKKLMK